jgi:signal transduction histidine kinase
MRVPEPRSSRGGVSPELGLGLYVVQQIVHAHGGRIEARSSETEGTLFVVELPRTAPRATSALVEPEGSS